MKKALSIIINVLTKISEVILYNVPKNKFKDCFAYKIL